VHGDYRLDNTIVDREAGPRIAAVLDWELSTLGDPLADLGLSMTYWHDLGDDERGCIPVAAGVTAWPGFPTARGFAESYAALSGTGLRNMEFYLALGAMKLAVILEGVHARYLLGRTVPGSTVFGSTVFGSTVFGSTVSGSTGFGSTVFRSTGGDGYDTAGAAVPVLIARGLRQLTTPFA
jgi:hypothetical protein